MSCRERLSTSRNRRSICKSNRSSIYIPTTYSSGVSSSYSSLSSSTYASNRSSLYFDSGSSGTSSRSSFVLSSRSTSSIDLTSVDSKLDELLRRTENFTSRVNDFRKSRDRISRQISHHYDNFDGYVSTEHEWKRLLDARMLIDKAVELIQTSLDRPKGRFEYSPEPSPRPLRPHEWTDTVLVSPPSYSSDDEEGGNYST